LCHADLTGSLELPSGEMLELSIDLAGLTGSVHGQHAAQQLACTDCHTDRQRYQYPHAPPPAQNLEEYRADAAQNCERCHVSAELHNPGHLQAVQTGTNANLPNCVDCHGSHEVIPAQEMYAAPIAFCRSCHQTFDDPRLAAVHTEVVASLDSPEHNCTTCHSDTVQSADAQCKNCHSLLTSWVTLESGEVIDPHITPAHIEASVHGFREVDGMQYTPLECTDCHRDEEYQSYPHPELEFATRRELTLARETICQDCHTDIYEETADGIHSHARDDGSGKAATCFDCHGSHEIQDPDDPRQLVSETCGNCHQEVEDQYKLSVHGAALLGEDNPDVPVCTDCHGVHNIAQATTNEFRLTSTATCANCHSNAEVMDKYGISTDVTETYVADFHGTTTVLFARESTHQEINTAVCTDCHGVHNILPATDENSQVMQANLLATCQQCHPDATENFSASWMSHYQPSVEHYPLVYFVNLFYRIVIPLTVGAFVLFIASDVYRRVWNRMRERKGGAH
jgi:nitrate/TMAO reductase-like tetraheme cytochrome c subunit